MRTEENGGVEFETECLRLWWPEEEEEEGEETAFLSLLVEDGILEVW